MPGRMKVGAPPGTLVHIGKKRSHVATIEEIIYTKDEAQEKTIKKVSDLTTAKDKTTWINVAGVHEVSLIDDIGKAFDIHPLVLEDIVNTDQRPKLEEYENYIYVVLKNLSAVNCDIELEQISIIIGENYVMTFQENAENTFLNIKDRLGKGQGKLRSNGSGYLAYAIIDTIVDGYFAWMDNYAESLPELESEIISSPSRDSLIRIQKLKNELTKLRKVVYPMRETVGRIDKVDASFIDRATMIYIRDVYDHTIQILDSIDTYRDILSGLLEIYLSNISNKMNEVMKVLTIIATIFIPLSFLAGVFGMNFSYMPELGWRYSYPIVILVMVAVAGLMLYFFRKKDWI